jgi:hypothetical protein
MTRKRRKTVMMVKETTKTVIVIEEGNFFPRRVKETKHLPLLMKLAMVNPILVH